MFSDKFGHGFSSFYEDVEQYEILIDRSGGWGLGLVQGLDCLKRWFRQVEQVSAQGLSLSLSLSLSHTHSSLSLSHSLSLTLSHSLALSLKHWQWPQAQGADRDANVRPTAYADVSGDANARVWAAPDGHVRDSPLPPLWHTALPHFWPAAFARFFQSGVCVCVCACACVCRWSIHLSICTYMHTHTNKRDKI